MVRTNRHWQYFKAKFVHIKLKPDAILINYFVYQCKAPVCHWSRKRRVTHNCRIGRSTKPAILSAPSLSPPSTPATIWASYSPEATSYHSRTWISEALPDTRSGNLENNYFVIYSHWSLPVFPASTYFNTVSIFRLSPTDKIELLGTYSLSTVTINP